MGEQQAMRLFSATALREPELSEAMQSLVTQCHHRGPHLNRAVMTDRLRAASCWAGRVRDRTQIRQIWAPGSWHQAVAFRPNANRQACFADFLAHRD
jgi:hypothetical protein